MIRINQQLKMAQQAILNLQKILLQERIVHSVQDYRSMSEPILLEMQQREQDILIYLSKTEAEVAT